MIISSDNVLVGKNTIIVLKLSENIILFIFLKKSLECCETKNAILEHKIFYCKNLVFTKINNTLKQLFIL